MAPILICPRDGVGTTLEKHHGRMRTFALDVCHTCGGVWYDHGEISKLTGEREIERLVVAYAGGRSPFGGPRGGEPMAARPGGQGVVDVCPSGPGAWVHPGQLEAVVKP